MTTAEQFREQVMALAAEVGVQPKESHVGGMKQRSAGCFSPGRLTVGTPLRQASETPAKAMLDDLPGLRFPATGRCSTRSWTPMPRRQETTVPEDG